MLILAVVINVGMWLNRYLIVVPGLADDHNTFSSVAEVAMTIGLLSGFLFVLQWLFTVFPMMSNWDLRSADAETCRLKRKTADENHRPFSFGWLGDKKNLIGSSNRRGSRSRRRTGR